MRLPNCTDQSGKSLRLVDDAIGVNFKYWSDRPFVRSLNDGVKEKFAMLIGCEIRLNVQVNGSRIPTVATRCPQG